MAASPLRTVILTGHPFPGRVDHVLRLRGSGGMETVVTGGEFNRGVGSDAEAKLFQSDVEALEQKGTVSYMDIPSIGRYVVPTVKLVIKEILAARESATPTTSFDAALARVLSDTVFVDNFRVQLGERSPDTSVAKPWLDHAKATGELTRLSTEIREIVDAAREIHRERKGPPTEAYFEKKWPELIQEKLEWPEDWTDHEEYRRFLDLLYATPMEVDAVMGDPTKVDWLKKVIRVFFVLRPPFPVTDILNTAALVHGMRGEFGVESLWHTVKFGDPSRRKMTEGFDMHIDCELDDFIGLAYAAQHTDNTRSIRVAYYLPEGSTPENKAKFDDLQAMLHEQINQYFADTSIVIRTPHAKNERAVLSAARLLMPQ